MADNGSSRWNGNYGSEETKRRSMYEVNKPRSPWTDTERGIGGRRTPPQMGDPVKYPAASAGRGYLDAKPNYDTPGAGRSPSSTMQRQRNRKGQGND